jgi:hypothetical protein
MSDKMSNEQKKEVIRISKLLKSSLKEKGYEDMANHADSELRGFSIPFKNAGTYSEILITVEWVV